MASTIAVRLVAVRSSASAGTWHLVDGRPLDAALCGAPRPRRGWWDLGPADWAPPAVTCSGCVAGRDELEAAEGQQHGG